MSTHLQFRSPLWRKKHQLISVKPPASLMPWLYDQSSLTRRLQQLGQGFRVQVYHQGIQRPFANESFCLGLPLRESALIRQVHLFCGDQPVVYARTIIPISSLVGRQRRLALLGHRSLGAVLFADKSMIRGIMDYAEITVDDPIYNTAMRYCNETDTMIWGRRSVFRLKSHPLLVNEFFLPSVFF